MWQLIYAFLAVSIIPLGKKLLVALGIGFVTYQGMSFLTDTITTYVFSAFNGLPVTIAQFVGLLRLDEAVNIIMSAIAFRAVVSGWSSGSKSHPVWRKPGSSPPPFEA